VKFFDSIVSGFVAATFLLLIALSCFLALYALGPGANAPFLTKWDSLILLLRMHYNTFLWVWVIMGVCLSALHRLSYVSLILKRR
jgi:hypothetical protein